MCVITVVPPNIPTPFEAIENGACANPDGHGWAVASERFGLVTGKSMDPKAAIEAFKAECERQGVGSYRLFHSRIGTHGSMNVDNVHPFFVPDASGQGFHEHTVMAHNGVMPAFWHPEAGDKRSDTRVFIARTAQHYITERGVPSRRGAKTLGQIIGSYNKLVFLSVRAGKPTLRIVNSTSGVWDGGVWYSNTSYKRKVYRQWRNGPTTTSSARKCKEVGCSITVYSLGVEKCYQHREKVFCAEKDCRTEVSSVDETLCFTHRPVRYCAEEGCGVRLYSSSDVACYRHRTTTGSGYVSPYASEDGWPLFESDPAEPNVEFSEEASSLLDDIEEVLKASGQPVTDVHEDKTCDVCQKTGTIHIATNLCLNCHWCLDCWTHMDDCECFDYALWMSRAEAERTELDEALEREMSDVSTVETTMTFEEWERKRAELQAFYGFTDEEMKMIYLGDEPPADVVEAELDDTREIPPVVEFSFPSADQPVDLIPTDQES